MTSLAPLTLIGALMLAVPAHAGNMSVPEGETAQFEITPAPKFHHQGAVGSVRVRLWYDTDGGTAVEGTDYETAHSWAHNVMGVAGSPMTISVRTFQDDAVEGDETFSIRIRKVQVQYRGRFGHTSWRPSPISSWKFEGVRTATIRDATPRHQHASYAEEKYGQGYTGTVWGE